MKDKPRKPLVHFLHIGKTGGSAVKHAIKQGCPESPWRIKFHPHGVNLEDIPEGDKVVYILRDPVKRFVSGFYSRQRQGKPRYNIPWRPGERKAFEVFDTPNELAAALSSWNLGRRKQARQAMRRIQHVKSSYWKWFKNEAYFRSRSDDILFVAFQEQLADDFEILKELLGCPASASLPQDDTKAHRNPADLDKRLDDKSVRNLEKWYRRDYRFINLSRQLRADLEQRRAAG